LDDGRIFLATSIEQFLTLMRFLLQSTHSSPSQEDMAILRFLRRRFQTSSLARFLTIVMLSAPLTACTGPKNTPQSMPKTPTSKAVELGPTSTTLPTLPTDSPPDPTPTLRPLPPIDESDHSLGVPDADITLLVYSDFQCPFCADFYQSWSQIEERHPGKLRLVFRHFPLLSLHDKADLAGAAAEVASESGKFWEMHDALFEGQSEWADLDRVAFVDWLTQTAAASNDPVLSRRFDGRHPRHTIPLP
jgi:hypothetical protein